MDRLGEPERSEPRRPSFGFRSGRLPPELPADENVALPLMLGGVPRREAVRRAREWFPVLGLSGKEERRPGELSASLTRGGRGPGPMPGVGARPYRAT